MGDSGCKTFVDKCGRGNCPIRLSWPDFAGIRRFVPNYCLALFAPNLFDKGDGIACGSAAKTLHVLIHIYRWIAHFIPISESKPASLLCCRPYWNRCACRAFIHSPRIAQCDTSASICRWSCIVLHQSWHNFHSPRIKRSIHLPIGRCADECGYDGRCCWTGNGPGNL
jgi:hypothetical protein